MAWPRDPEKLKLGGASWFKMLTTGTAIRTSDWRKIAKVTPEIADACLSQFGAYPQMVQPELIFKESKAKSENTKSAIVTSNLLAAAANRSPENLEIGTLPRNGWAKGASDQPPFDPVWNHSSNYSQITQAKAEVRAATGAAGRGIRIGILDVGYSQEHLLVPKNTIGRDGHPSPMKRGGEPIADAINVLARPLAPDTHTPPGETHGTHGMKSISMLAGGRFHLSNTNAEKVVIDQDVEIGGAPDATIVPARVAPWIFSHSTANLAYAIDYASRVQKCDVISMSHGGTPSALWIDAVNAAYERGTAMFAACGDYINFAPIDLGIIAPSSAVYPAACRRIQGVAGLSANGTPYGTTDLQHHPFYYLIPWHWFPIRGSFGADGARRDIFHTSIESMNERTDRAQVRWGGILRAQPISTWSPNVASARPPSDDPKGRFNALNLDWEGDSAATPQAAAAAALWLAKHRKQIEDQQHWNDWRKPEAVYVAMLKTAGGRKPGEVATPIETRQPDLYCGAGSLKAADMLKVDFNAAQSTKITSPPIPNRQDSQRRQLWFPDGTTGIARDFYDGQRSGAAILGLETEFPPYRQRADSILDRNHIFNLPNQKKNALSTIFYNQRLVQQWNIGRIPRRPESEDNLEWERDAMYPKSDSAKEHGQDRLKHPKNWFVRFFIPDSEELRKEANEMADRAVHDNP